jgi:hypothetical protein
MLATVDAYGRGTLSRIAIEQQQAAPTSAPADAAAADGGEPLLLQPAAGARVESVERLEPEDPLRRAGALTSSSAAGVAPRAHALCRHKHCDSNEHQAGTASNRCRRHWLASI